MPRRKHTDEKLVHIRPVEGVYIVGVSSREQDVTEAEWLVLDEYKPPAFTRDLEPVEDQPQEGK